MQDSEINHVSPRQWDNNQQKTERERKQRSERERESYYRVRNCRTIWVLTMMFGMKLDEWRTEPISNCSSCCCVDLWRFFMLRSLKRKMKMMRFDCEMKWMLIVSFGTVITKNTRSLFFYFSQCQWTLVESNSDGHDKSY